MKLLLILGSDDNYGVISENIQALGFEPIRYRHVVKAIDNIDEIDPAAIIVSARDFPRHWKILLQFVRNERPKESCPIIILKGGNFGAEEASKAFFLGANGALSDTLDNQEDIERLKNILGRAAPETEGKKNLFFPVEPWNRIGLLIANFSGLLINTDVKTISASGLSFVSLNPLPSNAVKMNKTLSECSLRVGGAILSPTCRVSGVGKTISLEFASFPEDERRVFDQYLEEFQTQEAN
ncbi:MAG: PilZ domain-containing protein [Treponema sp.]|jgi:DNA-binding response OmpR family regulator|nr:PilZ domain-containing protein [Treponema sp.]